MQSIVGTRLTFKEVLLSLGDLKLVKQTYRKHIQYHNHNRLRNIFKNLLTSYVSKQNMQSGVNDLCRFIL